MSIGVGGFVRLEESVSIEEQVELAYTIEKHAVLNKLGCKLGGNVSETVYDMYENYLDKNLILFELMGTPLDNYIDDLFCPSIDENSNKYEEEFLEKMNSNLGKIYNLFKVVLDNKKVENIHIDINYLWYEGEELQEINIEEFCKTVFKEYVNNDYFAPVMRISIENK